MFELKIACIPHISMIDFQQYSNICSLMISKISILSHCYQFYDLIAKILLHRICISPLV